MAEQELAAGWIGTVEAVSRQRIEKFALVVLDHRLRVQHPLGHVVADAELVGSVARAGRATYREDARCSAIGDLVVHVARDADAAECVATSRQEQTGLESCARAAASCFSLRVEDGSEWLCGQPSALGRRETSVQIRHSTGGAVGGAAATRGLTSGLMSG